MQSERKRGVTISPKNPRVLNYNIAYFLMDLLHFIVFNPRDLLFIANHLVTLFIFLTSWYLVSHGAYAILVLLILAEITSACQNTWTLAIARKNDAVFAVKLYDLLSAPFYTVHSIVRGLVVPYFVYKMFAFYASGAAKSVIPKRVQVSWIVVILIDISVSILWVSNLWAEFYRERMGKLDKKIR
ncbi:TLC domain-containing protein At5g14285-like [Juglans microcarpa x Juglans regia]|uniref:TLC domain-containing protein At5g14285-like n=1 Tax=Juglans microcarpa x Juglans regia TaxID=2249226 RepID=UPI001B7F5F3B|nr:TLC domain-containing protein At5g14285-like [Juglans microcarpa x Juglans regia]